MSPVPIQQSAAALDLSPRLFASETVAGSPALAAETVVCSVTCDGDIAVVQGIYVWGFAAFTVGTDGASVLARIRRDSVSGTIIAATGAVNEGVTAATQLATRIVFGRDEAPTMPGEVYVLTLTVASATAASTVSGASLFALAV